MNAGSPIFVASLGLWRLSNENLKCDYCCLPAYFVLALGPSDYACCENHISRCLTHIEYDVDTLGSDA